ncbi:uncharacterized protein LOC126781197 [Nymphalis io]|uniref:uncharacterized protein LOC126781197 n=1 Tax=Inachis io TaxID=171585 RepID=UPI002168B6C8|nr:uncharacterized protein LOC126781197 [Nymphalis io]
MKKQMKSRIIYGDQNFFVPSHLNFGAYILQKILAHNSGQAALINGATEEQITYGEMAQKIVNIASSLSRLGVREGDVVAIFSENRIEYLLTTLAVYYSGAIITFFNNAYTKGDLTHAISISKPKYMFISGEVYKTQYEVIENTKTIQKYVLFDDVPLQSNSIYFKELSEKHIDIKSCNHFDFKGTPQTCMILYSSGTTGLAKGAKINHLNLIVSSQQPMMTDKYLTPLMIAPWSSTMGIIRILKEIAFGRTFVFLSKYNERQYLKTIQKYKIGLLSVAPPLIVMLYKSSIVKEFDMSSVEIIYSGGAPITLESIRQLKTRFPHMKVLQGYGMTEATGAVTEDLDNAPREGSVGRIVPGNIIKIADPETNKTLGCGEPGEVRIKGLIIFGGYVGRDMQNDFDAEGFYKTGDIAYYDEDGYFYIVDRIKELIKYKGWQVTPSELEAVILQHPAVKDAGVTGAPDTLAGELPTAFVVKQTDAKITEQEIIDYVSDKVAPWKRLRGGVIFLKEIPKTASGKILRRELQALLSKLRPQKLPASKL